VILILRGVEQMKRIQVLKPKYRVEECLEGIRECLEIGWTGMGFKTVEFEEEWKKYTKLSNAHFLNSATSGLHLAVKILKEHYGWKDGDEVISTAFTFVSTNHAIKYENLTPVFADIDASLNLDPEAIKVQITSKTKAIIFVGVGGNSANLQEVIEIARENDIKIILDAAHMSGSKIDGRHVGFDVDVTVFSYQAVKNLPTADSGMICFSDEKLDKRARQLSWLGINKDTYQRSDKNSYKWDYNVASVGYKYHGNSIMAALGLVGLKYLDEDNLYRKELVRDYIKCLDGNIKYIEHDKGTSRHVFQVLVENREEVIEHLSQNGVYPGVHYRDNMEYPIYTGELLENTQFYSDRILSLPLHLTVTNHDVVYICKKILECVKK
jgi:dTDP-4-amino-4,6-dideoxygalactose transaminase